MYTNGFKKLSGDKGFLTLNESKELLQRTQFSPNLLKKIWSIIGLDNSGNMSFDQFVVAMQLIAKARAGVEIPDVLPGSLERIINKNKPETIKIEAAINPIKLENNQTIKEEVKKTGLKDPEPYTETPKPVSKSTFGETVEDNSKFITSRADNEKHIKEKEKTIKEKTEMLKNICELLEFDTAELEMIKEKNKMLEEKFKENEANYAKISNKVNKAKEKFEKELIETSKTLDSLKKENSLLQEKISKASSVKVSEPEVIEKQAVPKKSLGFEFDSFFKEPLNNEKKDPVIKPVETRPSFGFNTESSENVKNKDLGFTKFEEPKKESEKPNFSLNSNFFNQDSLFSPGFQAKPVQEKKEIENPSVKIESYPELKPINKIDEKLSAKPDFRISMDDKFAAKPDFKLKTDDIFAGLDQPFTEIKPNSSKKQVSSSSSEDPELQSAPVTEFGFKFTEDLEKKIEKPPGFDFKPENLAFPAQFEGFSKGFAFPNASPAFDNEFFKIDTQAIKSKAKPRDLDFD